MGPSRAGVSVGGRVITWGVGSATGLFLTSKLGIVRVLGGVAAGAEEGVAGPQSRPDLDTEVPHTAARATSHAAGPQAAGAGR